MSEAADITNANPMIMLRRSGMVERRMDGGRFLVRGLQKAKAEMALAVTAYNMTRAIKILGTNRVCQALVI